MNFKKIIYIPLLSVLGMTSYASYVVQYPEVPVTFKDLGKWVQNETAYTNWINVGSPHDCASGSPLENTQQLGETYTKTFVDCKQEQERTATTSEKNTLSGAIRNSISTKEKNVLTNATYTANSVGTTDFGQWLATEPVYTDWRNLDSPHDCTSAAPLENTQTLGSSYPKVFSGCQQTQERTITTSEKNTISGVVRNIVNTKETKLLTDATYTVTAIGTKVVKECGYSGTSGHAYRWYDIANGDIYSSTYGMGLQWDGVTKIDTTNIDRTYPKATTFVNGGYIYTRGAYKMKGEYYDRRLYYYYYEVCREPVTP